LGEPVGDAGRLVGKFDQVSVGLKHFDRLMVCAARVCFNNVARHIEIIGFHTIFLITRRRKNEDYRTAQFGIGPNRFEKFEPVHFWHIEIQQDDKRHLHRGMAIFATQPFERLKTVMGHTHTILYVHFFEDTPDRHNVDFVIIYDKIRYIAGGQSFANSVSISERMRPNILPSQATRDNATDTDTHSVPSGDAHGAKALIGQSRLGPSRRDTIVLGFEQQQYGLGAYSRLKGVTRL
jgi:hypothetical protein